MHRAQRVVPAVAAAVLLLAGCAQLAPSAPTPSSSPSAPAQPMALLGTWQVSGSGIPDGTWVRFDAGGYTIDRGGHGIRGGWDAADGRFTADIIDWDGAAGDPASPWLTGARAFSTSGTGAVLLSASGGTLATLTADTHPPASVQAVVRSEPQPEPAASVFATPRAAPAPVPTTAELLGTWVTGLQSPRGAGPSLRLKADGTYLASDGCNGVLGSWQLLPDGRLLRTSGVNGDVGCNNLVPVDVWMVGARTVGLAGGRLTLYDVQGRALGSLTRG